MLKQSVLLAILATLSLADVQSLYGQCGGTNWTGATECADGLTCVSQNDYYYQCTYTTYVYTDATGGVFTTTAGAADDAAAAAATTEAAATSEPAVETTDAATTPAITEATTEADTAAVESTEAAVEPTEAAVESTGAETYESDASFETLTIESTSVHDDVASSAVANYASVATSEAAVETTTTEAAAASVVSSTVASTTAEAAVSASAATTLSTVTTSAASGTLAGVYDQCGGSTWTGPTECVNGASCVTENEAYAQCSPTGVATINDVTGTAASEYAITTHATGVVYEGRGTYWGPSDGNACGLDYTDGDYVVAIGYNMYEALGVDEYNHSTLCGKSIKVTYNGNEITVKVLDECGSCLDVDLDFSPDAFAALADLNDGTITVNWEWLD